MMPVLRAESTDATQTAFESHMANYQKCYYKLASSDDYSESKMTNYSWMKSKGNYSYGPSWSAGTLEGIIVAWQQVLS